MYSVQSIIVRGDQTRHLCNGPYLTVYTPGHSGDELIAASIIITRASYIGQLCYFHPLNSPPTIGIYYVISLA